MGFKPSCLLLSLQRVTGVAISIYSCIILRQWGTGEENGEEDEAAAVDEGRCSDTENACAREDEDNGDRSEAEAELYGDAAKSIVTWCDAGDRSGERGVMGVSVATECLMQKSLEEVVGLAKGFLVICREFEPRWRINEGKRLVDVLDQTKALVCADGV